MGLFRKYYHSSKGASCGMRLFVPSLAIMLGLASLTHGQGNQTTPQKLPPFVDGATYSSAVPTPESILGHAIGHKAIRYGTLISYLHMLAEASSRVTLTAYGQTHEGRRLYYLTITSEANHRRLEEIKANNGKLADPRRLTDSEQGRQLIDRLPAIAWLNYSIHGDELSSTDAAAFLAYHLAASTDDPVRTLLDEVVVHINPLANADGRERFLSHIEQLTGVVPSPDIQSMQHQALWSQGRGNHYLFDLNRDWLINRQPEVATLAKAILDWNPHLLIDSHEQGPYETYLFDPPRDPINNHLSPAVLDWRRRFGADQAEAFNRYGWSYYTQDWYSEWSPIYTNAWASLQGAIGLLYEQACVDASSVKHPTGHVLTYRQSVHHQITSSLANLGTLHAHRREILGDFLADRQWAIRGEATDSPTLVVPPASDTARWNAFLQVILSQGIEVQSAQHAFEVSGAKGIWDPQEKQLELPQGTLIIPTNQPHRRMVLALCDFDPHFTEGFLLKERKEVENRRDSLLYDVTSWNLPMAFGLKAFWVKSKPRVELGTITPATARSAISPQKARYGYLIDGQSSDAYHLLARLYERQCHLRVASKPFQMHGMEYKRGTILLRCHENPPDLPLILAEARAELDVDIRAIDTALVSHGPDLGSAEFALLATPRVAIASQWPVRATSFGSVWYLLDHQLGLRTSPINIQNLGRIDLRKYNVLVLPEGRSYERVLDEDTIARLKQWTEGGGTLIALGSAAAFVASQERGLSSVRLRRDVLDKLAQYEEAVSREKQARAITIVPGQIWGTAIPQDARPADAEQPAKKADVETLKRTDEWQRLFSPQGTFLRASVDTEHWLSFGLEDKLPVLFSGSYAFMSEHPVATPVRLSEAQILRLSGLLWPEVRGRLAETAYATAESKGQGQVILFATDPTVRMWLPAVQRLFLNAILLGPGLGTSQPAPW